MKQTTLDRRDKRRAQELLKAAKWERLTYDDLIAPIAAALKRERDETGMSAVNWFLFSERSTKAKAKRAIAQKYCKRKHLDKRGKA